MTEAGYKFTVVYPDVDESAFCTDDISPWEYARKLAAAKAKAVASDYPESLVIGADTVVDFQGQIIGKPADAADARQIIRKIFGKSHKVITGVAILRMADGTELIDSDATTVYPRKMTADQIAEHIASGSWRGKAGAYAIQETGDKFVERIEGSLTNVMGLPMELLGLLLAGLGVSAEQKRQG